MTKHRYRLWILMFAAAVLTALVAASVSLFLRVPDISNGWQRFHFWLSVACAIACLFIARRERIEPVRLTVCFTLVIASVFVILFLLISPPYWSLLSAISLFLAVPFAAAIAFAASRLKHRRTGA